MSRKKTYKTAERNKTLAKENSSRYITFCNSPEEMEQDNYKYWLSLSPEERIAQVTFLLENIFSDEIKKVAKNPRIIFDNP